MTTAPEGLDRALAAPDASVRLQAALAAGTHPDPARVGLLVARCAVEPDFFVRDMLTWALTRHPADLTVPLLLAEVTREVAADGSQARSQALHTLSKVGDPRGWAVVTPELLRDPDDEVARAAWRAAVVLVPADRAGWLAEQLAGQLGRGDRDVRLSLSRALVDLGEPAAPALATAAEDGDDEVRSHALATQRLVRYPDEGFDVALWEAQRVVTLEGAPLGDDVTPR